MQIPTGLRHDLCRGNHIVVVEAVEVCGTINNGTEYMVALEADKKVIWMKDFIGELGMQ